MKISQAILSIPPYISTTWDLVISLHTEASKLIITLKTGLAITIPELTKETLQEIYETHALFLENQSKKLEKSLEYRIPFPLSQLLDPMTHKPEDSTLSREAKNKNLIHFNLDNLNHFGSLKGSFHHNPEDAHFPELPKELLDKIAAIVKIMKTSDVSYTEPLDENCHCPHCQISRTLFHEQELTKKEILPLPPIDTTLCEADLTFQQWEIKNIEENLYDVINCLDPNETYKVFLGNPVGCTCGQLGCEHIIAVLKS